MLSKTNGGNRWVDRKKESYVRWGGDGNVWKKDRKGLCVLWWSFVFYMREREREE